MPELRNRLSQALVTAGDELAKRLVESGQWDLVDGSAPEVKKRAPRKVTPAAESKE